MSDEQLPDNEQLDKNQVVTTLHSALLQGTSELETAMPLLRRTLEEELWRRRVVPETGEVVKFNKFVEFIEAPPPQGLGTTFAQLWNLCDEEPVILDLLDQAVLQGPGAKEGSRSSKKEGSSVSTKELERPTGTSRQAGLRRLRKQAPHLHQLVLEGKMSVNAALIEAGLRTKQITVFVDPNKGADAIKRAFNKEQLMQLIAKLILDLSTNPDDLAVYSRKVNQVRIQKLISVLERIKPFASDVDTSKEEDTTNFEEE